MKNLLLLIFLFISNYNFCQVGYLGKKTLIKMNIMYGKYTPFNGGEIEHTLSRRVSVNFTIEKFRNEYSFPDNQKNILERFFGNSLEPPYEKPSYIFDNNNEVIYQHIPEKNPQDGLTALNNSSVFSTVTRKGLTFKIYVNKNLKNAPFGPYIQFAVFTYRKSFTGGIFAPNNIISYNEHDPLTTENYKSYQFYSQTYVPINNLIIGNEFMTGFGYQHIFHKRFSLDINFSMGHAVYDRTLNSKLGNYSVLREIVSQDIPEIRENDGNILRVNNKTTSLSNSIFYDASAEKYTSFNMYLTIRAGILF